VTVLLEYLTVAAIGAVGYGFLEIIYRGFTHWSMMIAGAVSFLLIHIVNKRSREKKWRKWIMGAFLITTVEFVIGAIVNVRLGLGVWDYSNRWINLCGQICPLFSAIWFVIGIPVFELSSVLFRVFSRARR